MLVAYIVVILLALLPQLLFSVLYWKWIPSWTKNPYGRLAQLDSVALILLLLFFLFVVILGDSMSQGEKRAIAVVLMFPFIVGGFFKLTLLKRAVDSSKEGETRNDN